MSFWSWVKKKKKKKRTEVDLEKFDLFKKKNGFVVSSEQRYLSMLLEGLKYRGILIARNFLSVKVLKEMRFCSFSF